MFVIILNKGDEGNTIELLKRLLSPIPSHCQKEEAYEYYSLQLIIE